MTDEKLLELALDARKNAYVPYSGYAVGAALLAEDGRVFTGCNVENAAYGNTLCAERTALVKAGAARLYVANRTIDRAHALAARCPEVIRPIPFDGDDLCRAAAESGLLVNATSLGMAGKGEFSDLDFLRRAPDGSVVYDLVYHPRCTRLLQAAAALGLSTIPGTELLLYQAVGAFSLFTGCAPDVPALREMLGDALK